jgi:hypothetical protein
MMKFNLKKGSVNIILEKGYHKATDILTTLRRFGHNILIISRRSNRDMLKRLSEDNEDQVFWLEERGKGLHSLDPNPEKIFHFLERRVDRASVVVLDRIDFIISKFGFKDVISLLHKLVELFYHRKAMLLLLVDPSTVGQEELSRLEKDAPILEAKRAIILPDELQEILVHVNQQNRMDIEPSYKAIGKRFRITKTTTRKRIQQLLILELLAESKRGRTKVLRVSDKGLRFLLAQGSRIG